MKVSTWIVLIVIGVVLLVIGASIAWRVVWETGPYGIPIATMPFLWPGYALIIVGILIIGVSSFVMFWRWFIGTQKEAAKEIISEGIRRWKEPVPPPPPATNVKYCPKCGASMSLDATYCPRCGQKQT